MPGKRTCPECGGGEVADEIDRSELERALENAERDYRNLNPKSLEHWRSACVHLPRGNTRSILHFDPFPVVLDRGQGARVWDIDGNERLDFLNEYGAGLYGHSDRVISAALRTAIADGLTLGGLNKYETELARLVRERFPSFEKVRFCNSATEASLYAIGLARAATDRTDVMVFDGAYHGGNLSFATRASRTNAPYPYRFGTYNDVEKTFAELNRDSGDIAALIIEPMMAGGGGIPAESTFLRALREETKRLGVILIFDEAMTSRMSPGGLQGYHKITPDLTACGKYLGGGLASGVFGGRADIMDLIDGQQPNAVIHSGTFNNNVLAMAAGAAGLRDVFSAERAADLHARGDRLRQKLNDAGRGSGVPVSVTGIGSLMAIHLQSRDIRRPADLEVPDAMRKLLHLELLNRGFYIARRGYITLSLPLSDRDCDQFVLAFKDVLKGMARIYERGVETVT
jgi:glutamate-1-semialdehyde 2,1-aminomutase